MRVIISTIGKFHSFDLARQLHKRGALASIFSGYPWFKLKGEGLPKAKVKTYPYLHGLYMGFPPRRTSVRHLWEWQDRLLFDRYVARHLPPCDIFCGLSGSGLHTSRVARSQGAKYVCDRGSTHIRFQDRVLREEYDRQRIPYAGIGVRMIRREEAEYEAADVITVPSRFVLNTFIEAGIARQKMRLAPYGVDLDRFYPCARRSESEFRILFVGNVSVQKGVSYLLAAFQQLQCENKYLTLVGSVSRELENIVRPFQRHPRISFTGHVPQQELKRIMSVSHVMILPSIQEGLACVQAQAMACGCPVIASQNTGADDLFEDGKEGYIVPIRDTNAIADRLQRLADDADLRSSMSEAALQRVRAIGGWEQYGQNIYNIFSELIPA